VQKDGSLVITNAGGAMQVKFVRNYSYSRSSHQQNQHHKLKYLSFGMFVHLSLFFGE
jgi:hypothetical protein